MPAEHLDTPSGDQLVTLDNSASAGSDVVTLEAQPIPAGADASTPPAEVRLLPAGTFRTTKGSFTFDAAAAKAVLAKAKDWGNDYCFDMGHAMVAPPFGGDPAATERAYGWYRLKVNAAGELVTDGLKWTDRGADMLTKREVRYISPAIRTDKDGRVTEFVNAALTNLPATKGQTPIVASRNSEEHAMDPTLLAALGLSKSASEADALAALTALRDFRKEVVALTGKQDDEESLEELSTWKQRAGEVAELSAKLDKIKAKKAEKKVQKTVQKALDKGVIPPSLKEKMVELGRKDPDLLKEYVKNFDALNAKKQSPGEKKSDDGDVTALSKEDLEVCKTLGLDPKKFAESKKGGVAVSEFTPTDKGEDKSSAATK